MSASTPAEALAELVDAGPSLPPETVRAVLAEIWPGLHAPLRQYGTAVLIAMFRHAGYVTDGTAMPDDGLVIYRGEPVRPCRSGYRLVRGSGNRFGLRAPVRHDRTGSSPESDRAAAGATGPLRQRERGRRKGATWNRVDVVEVDDAIRRDAVIGGREFEIEASPRTMHVIAALPT